MKLDNNPKNPDDSESGWKEDQPMTTSTPLTQGILGQQGSFGQGFAPFGNEQSLGMPQQPNFGQYGQYTNPFTQQWYGGSSGQQVPFGAGQQHHLQQAVQQAATQILPYVQQAIMPHVAAQAVALVGQQVQQQVPQIVAQILLGQQGQSAWQQAAGHRPF